MDLLVISLPQQIAVLHIEIAVCLKLPLNALSLEEVYRPDKIFTVDSFLDHTAPGSSVAFVLTISLSA